MLAVAQGDTQGVRHVSRAGHRSEAERGDDAAPAEKPVGVHSELWSYEIAGGSQA